MQYDPEWIVANLDDMIELCTAISMQESVEALKVARRVCEWEAINVKRQEERRVLDLLERSDHH